MYDIVKYGTAARETFEYILERALDRFVTVEDLSTVEGLRIDCLAANIPHVFYYLHDPTNGDVVITEGRDITKK